MSLIEINWSPTPKQLRQFGGLCLIVLPLVGWLWGASFNGLVLQLGCAAVIAGLAWFRPQWVRPLFVGLILLAAPVGMIVGELAMLLIYFGIFLPISLLFRIARRDGLQLRIDRSAESYWQTKLEPKDIASYYRRY
ncbi:MAG: hypothetical protein SFV81_02925 [Pirellulaceae bacterium]|nr:hypothetical protein [Pirellulaceae bacterium]